MKKINISNITSVILIIYSLFAFTSFKKIGSPYIDGIQGNNLIYLIPIVLFIKFLTNSEKKINLKIVILFLIYIIYLLLNLIFNYNSQAFYSIMIIILPMLLITSANKSEGKNVNQIIKVLVSLGLIYSIFIIFEFFFYNIIAQYFNLNTTADYVTRHTTMLGSSITTSYYLLLNIPICFMGFHYFDKKWKKITIITIILSVFSIILEQSRICFVILGIYLILYFLLFGKKVKLSTKILAVLGIIFLLSWVMSNESLSRLYTDYSDNTSTQTRISIIKIGFNEFLNKPILGSGISTYYKRLWHGESRYILINGGLSLIDPHNIYIYILVEQGIMGMMLFVTIFILIIKEYIKYMPKYIRINTYILILGQLLAFYGGSQLINEISYSTIFWNYMLILCSIGLYERSKKDETNSICNL